MSGEELSTLKSDLLNTCRLYKERIDRAKRIYIENRAYALKDNRDIEYDIKNKVAKYFSIEYSSVAFTGSAQIGFSIHKDTLFDQNTSDLDIACIDLELFNNTWKDIIKTTRAFTDVTPFSGDEDSLEILKESIVKRGMVLIDNMPRSSKSVQYRELQHRLSREYSKHFSKVTLAIYMNEYAFCWKQDSALSTLINE